MKNWLSRKKQTIQRCAFACSLAVVVVLAGCATYPMGLTKDQWEALSPEQQAEQRAKQTEIDAKRRAEREARLQEERRLAEEQRRQAEERLQAIYANPKFGDIIVVQIEGGEIGIGETRYPYQPVRFELAKGETKWINFVRQDRSNAFRQLAMSLSDDGSLFYFDRDSRKTIRINNDGWQNGRTYHPEEVTDIQFGSGARNIRIYVRFKEAPAQAR